MADITIQVANNSAVNSSKSSIAIKANRTETPKVDKKKSETAQSTGSKEFKDVISVSKDGDTASASVESKAMLEESAQKSDSSDIIKTQAQNRAQHAKNMLHTQIANEELQDDLTGEATIETGKVKIDKPNPYIETLKNELKEEIREAEAAIRDNVPTEQLQNIELEESKALTEAKAGEGTQITSDNTSGFDIESLKESAGQNADKSSNEPQVISYDGYTDQQLRQMYLSGTISRYNYDQEMAARSEENQKITENEQIFREGIVRNIDRGERVDRTSEAIKNFYSDSSSDTLTAEQRLDILEAAEMNYQEEA